MKISVYVGLPYIQHYQPHTKRTYQWKKRLKKRTQKVTILLNKIRTVTSKITYKINNQIIHIRIQCQHREQSVSSLGIFLLMSSFKLLLFSVIHCHSPTADVVLHKEGVKSHEYWWNFMKHSKGWLLNWYLVFRLWQWQCGIIYFFKK